MFTERLSPERTWKQPLWADSSIRENFQQSEVPSPRVFRLQSLDSGALTEMGKVNGGKIRQEAIPSMVGMRRAQWAHSLHRQRCRRQQEKEENPSELVPPPGTPSSSGHPAGTGDPPSWNQPTSPGKLSFEFRMRKGVLYVSNDETGVQQRIRYKAASAL